MRGRVMKVRTSITEPGVSIAWSWNLFWMKRRSGSRRSFAATIARESREDHLSRVRFRDSGRRMAWLCHSKLRLGSAIKPAARMRRHDPPERLFTVLMGDSLRLFFYFWARSDENKGLVLSAAHRFPGLYHC